ncbi:MAG TPA: amino acid adenylation domain-containing protein, partial [Ktedonobacteraceae bacterium]|nr:amino acid adenylation domain-containing protein [Ktedonobacteraceae bacterium]
PVQLITPHFTLPLPIIDITHLSPIERESTQKLILQQEEQQPFDLEHGPLLRTTLIHSAKEENTLILTMHHIISDGWSMSVFSHELSACYTAHVRGIPPVLPELPIQYSDFAVWQRTQLQREIAEQLAYWKQELAGAPSLLELPTDYPRPAAQTFHGAWQHFTLSSHLSEQLRTLSLHEGVTLFMLLQAAFALLLARYSGQDDIIIGSPIANRTRTELEGLIGFFVNTLALRTRLTGNPTFHEVLAQVRKTTLDAYAHQDIPFEKLIEELAPERSLSYSPLFQVLFILQNVPQWQLKMADVTARKVGDEGDSVMFDLTLALVDDPQHLRGVFGYKSALFAPSTITRMVEHWQILLESIVANPKQRISNLPMLSKAEQYQLLTEWDATSHVPAQSACVHTLFEAQAEQIPDAIAVTFEGDSISYAALNRRSNQLAHSLRELKGRPTEPVALILSRGPQQIIALLGVLKAGCPFVCFDPHAPIARLQTMLAELAPGYIITEARYLQSHPENADLCCQTVGRNGHILLLDVHADQAARPLPLAEGEEYSNKYHDWTYIESHPRGNPPLNIHVTDPAYIAYTSGSTGVPKGIVESHYSFHHFLTWFSRACKLHSLRRIAQWASLTFDPALDEIFATLCFGATLCMTTDTIMADPGAVVRWVQREQIMLLQTVPSFLRYMLQAIEDEQIEPSHHPFPHLEFLLMVGEVLPIELAERILQRLAPTAQLLNLYGPTEAIVATRHTVEAIAPNQRSIPVGRPIDGCQVLILDQHQQLCPIGVIGEIYIRGHYLSSGYFRRPEETQRAFMRNPLRPESEDRVYRTGDTGRWLPDGTIEFFGRRDHQVKIRGMRVELEEVEAVLLRHQSIRACAVVAHQDQRQTTRLVAYIVPSEAHTQSLLTEIQPYLRTRLPDYMQPAMFVIRETLPRTSSGKIDRRALPPPDWDYGRKEVIAAPRTPLEEMLVDIWAEVLQAKQVSIHDDFFALGGHSLLATRFIARIRDVFQVELSVRVLFGAPTIEELAKCIETARQAGHNMQMPPIKPVSRDKQQPLSFAQQRLWFLEQLTPGIALYTIVTAIQLEGVLNIAALARSLHALVQRHEILRTSFGMNSGQPVQIIAPSHSVALPVINLSGLSVPEQEAERDRLMQTEERRSFDLAHGPLFYVWLLRLSADKHVLLLTVHHSISDAWSMGVFLRELSALYNAYTTNIPIPLPALPLQYADFAHWQRTWLQGSVLETQLAYWKEQLAGIPEVLALPTDRPRPALQTFDGAEHSFILPADLSDALKMLSRRERVTLFMTLYTAFVILLARYSGQDAIVIGSPIANRTHTA